MLLAFLLFAFILGSMMGSFITAWVWRTHNGRSMLEKHSVCPACQHPLGPLDLVPILSWLALRGRCRYCRAPISAQYILTEVSTALLFTLMGLQAASGKWQAIGCSLATCNLPLATWIIVSLIFIWAMVVFLVALCIYDLHWGELPDQWTLGGAALALLATIVAIVWHQPLLWQPGISCGASVIGCSQVSTPTIHNLLMTVLSGVLPAAFFALVIFISEKILHKPGMGWGDVKLALLMGFLLGFPGILVALYLAFISGAVISLFLISAKRQRADSSIPFGPFLVGGTLLALWLTPLVTSWYLHFLT